MKIIILVLAAIFCGCAPARAEPISTFIGLTALIEGVGFSAGVAGAIGGVLVGGALSVGLNFAAKLFQPSTGGSALSSQNQSTEARISTRQSTPSKRVPYGIVQAGGALNLEECKPPYFYRQYLISAEEIDGLDAIYIGTQKLNFASLVPDTILTPIPVDGQPNYPARLRVCFRLGKTDQAACPLAMDAFPNLGSDWRQRGIATVTVECHYGSDDNEHQALWGITGDPNFMFVMRGIKVYDPRDPTQDRDDASTWKFRRTAVLAQNDYLRRDFGGRIPARKIPYDEVALDADYDDELVTCLDGSVIPRYTVDGMVTMNQSPGDTITQMCTANRGTPVQTSGTVRVASSRPKTPVATIYDAILAGGLHYENGKAKRDSVNYVQTRFIAPDREYNLNDGPPWFVQDDIDSDGEKLVATLQLPYTRDYRIAERLAKAFYDTARLGKNMTVPVDLRLLAEARDQLPNNPINFDCSLFPKQQGTFKVGQMSLGDAYSSINLDLSQYDASIERNWLASRDEKPFTIADLDMS
jgi:hypothetical protein